MKNYDVEVYSFEWDSRPVEWKEQALKRIGVPLTYATRDYRQVIKGLSDNKIESLNKSIVRSIEKDPLETSMILVEFSDGVKRKVPFVIPMRPISVDDKEVPRNGWLAEEKKDGSLALQYTKDGAVAYVNRAKRNKTAIYPELIEEKIPSDGLTITQGEVYALKGGKDSFEDFLKRDLLQDPEESRARMKKYPLKFEAFDIIMKDDLWLDPLPTHKRKEILRETIPTGMKNVRVSRTCRKPEELAKKLKKDPTVEGIIFKKKDAPYVSGDDPDWRKLKVTKIADVAIRDYEVGEGKRKEIATLTAEVWDKKKGRLVEVADVGTGFTDEELANMKKSLDRGETLFAKVEYLKVGSQGRLRVPSFKGLRDDITIKETHV